MTFRPVLFGTLLIACFFAVSPPASAIEEDKAKAFIRTLTDEALKVVKDENMTTTKKSEFLREILRKNFDVKTFGNFALGVHRKEASDKELADYLTAFEDYIVFTYSAQLGKFAGEKIEIPGTRPAGKSKTDIFVLSNIVRDGHDPIPLTWRVREVKGKTTVVDIEIEGTSQILAYKQEFASVIKNRGEGVPGLIAELKEKNTSLQTKIAADG